MDVRFLYRQLISFLKSVQTGYKFQDKILILLHTIFYYTLYFLPIKSRNFLSQFTIKNSDGLYFCRDMSDVPIISDRSEPVIRSYFKSFNRGTFVDIGAHIGKYTVMVANQLNHKGKVISIEPEYGNFKILRKNIELNNCQNVITFKSACWDREATLKFYYHTHCAQISAIQHSRKFILVKATTLDNIAKKIKLNKIDLIKIDVEGAESKVLAGMKTILKNSSAKIIFEAWNEDYVDACRNVLKKYNYKIKQLDEINWLAYK